MGKKKWRKPKLLVLLRGSEETNVLQSCKAFSVSSSNPQGTPGGAYQWCKGDYSACVACSGIGGS